MHTCIPSVLHGDHVCLYSRQIKSCEPVMSVLLTQLSGCVVTSQDIQSGLALKREASHPEGALEETPVYLLRSRTESSVMASVCLSLGDLDNSHQRWGGVQTSDGSQSERYF